MSDFTYIMYSFLTAQTPYSSTIHENYTCTAPLLRQNEVKVKVY